MATRSTQGQVLGYVQESALGTNGGVFQDIRFDSIDFPTATKSLMANPNIGHAHAFNKSDKPIVYEKFQSKAVKLSTKIRQATANNTTCPIGHFFESMGCNVSTNTNTTVATYTSTILWTLTADVGGVGLMGLMELEDGMLYPVLIAEYVAGTKTVTPSMALPSAAGATHNWYPMTSIYPLSQPVPATKTLAFEVHTRGLHTTGEDLAYELQGCALEGVGNLILKPSEAPVMSFDFCMGKNPYKSDAIIQEVFVDSEKFPIVNDDFRVEFATASAAGGIARADVTLIEAEITYGVSAIPIPGEGTGVFAGLQGYQLKAESPRVRIKAMFDKAVWTELEGSNTSKYIGLVQPTRSILTPAFGFWLPNAYIDSENPPVADFKTDNYITGTVTYIGTCAGYSEDTLNSAAGAAPWYYGISGRYVAA